MLRALRDIRSFRVVVLHPADAESDELVAQIRRIGCRVALTWPPHDGIPDGTDIAFLLFRQDALTDAILRSLEDRPLPITLIAIVESESPTVIEAVVRSGASAVITKPIRAFGLLTSMVIAHKFSTGKLISAEKISRLQTRLLGTRVLEQAKVIVMSRRGMTEPEAYALIRERAMANRSSIEAVCASIVSAGDVPGR